MHHLLNDDDINMDGVNSNDTNNDIIQSNGHKGHSLRPDVMNSWVGFLTFSCPWWIFGFPFLVLHAFIVLWLWSHE
jgi:hypothetical protein